MQEELLYERVVQELHESGPKPGLWAKAFAESNGNDTQAKALYLRYRVVQLEEQERNILEAQVIEKMERKKKAYLLEEQERKKLAKLEGITAIHMILIGLPVLFIILFVLRHFYG